MTIDVVDLTLLARLGPDRALQLPDGLHASRPRCRMSKSLASSTRRSVKSRFCSALLCSISALHVRHQRVGACAPAPGVDDDARRRRDGVRICDISALRRCSSCASSSRDTLVAAAFVALGALEPAGARRGLLRRRVAGDADRHAGREDHDGRRGLRPGGQRRAPPRDLRLAGPCWLVGRRLDSSARVIWKPSAISGGVHAASVRRVAPNVSISLAQVAHRVMCAAISSRSPGSHSSYRYATSAPGSPHWNMSFIRASPFRAPTAPVAPDDDAVTTALDRAGS